MFWWCGLIPIVGGDKVEKHRKLEYICLIYKGVHRVETIIIPEVQDHLQENL